MISNSLSFISGILRIVSPLGKKFIFCSLLRFEIRKNYDFQTLRFKLHSFIPLKLYVNGKDPTHGRETASVFNLIHVIYERTLMDYLSNLSMIICRQFSSCLALFVHFTVYVSISDTDESH